MWHARSLVTPSGISTVACGLYFLDQGSNLGPLHWEHGVLAARLPVVIQSLSHVQLFVTRWTAACQASLSFVISQCYELPLCIRWPEYWSFSISPEKSLNISFRKPKKIHNSLYSDVRFIPVAWQGTHNTSEVCLYPWSG